MAPKSTQSSPYLLMMVTLMIIIICLTLIALHSTLYETIIHSICADHAYLHESTDCINNRSWEKPVGYFHSNTLFERRPILENLSASADEAWEQNLLTPKGGFLWVQLNETSKRAWGISMFHALHCLQTLRDTIQMSEVDDIGHIGHCIGYIAQVR